MGLVRMGTSAWILVILLAGFLGNAEAQMTPQNRWYLGASLELGLPLGQFGDIAGIGCGGHATVGYLTSPDFMVTANVGYVRFPGKGVDIPGINAAISTPSVSLIPVTIGGRCLFDRTSDMRPFLGGEAGLYIVRTDFSIGDFSVGETSTSLGLAPLAGALLNTSQRLNPDIFAKYAVMTNGWSPSWTSLSLGAKENLQ